MRACCWAFVCSLVASCAPALPPVRAADLDAARERWPDTTRADLDEGRSLYAAKCSGCHPLVLPDEQPRDQWPSWVDRMAARAGLAPAEQRSLTRYLWSASR